MKSLIKPIQILALLVTVIQANQVMAQESSGTHGGDPNELATFVSNTGENLESWYSVKADLIQGLRMNQHLNIDLKDVDADEFKRKFLAALRTAKVEFDEKTVVVNDVLRPCENSVDASGVGRIHCNIAQYIAAMKLHTPETQYKMIAHEYLGIAGLEPNVNGVSDYRFSCQISSRLSNINIKRWAIFPVQKVTPHPTGRCKGDGNQMLRNILDVLKVSKSQIFRGVNCEASVVVDSYGNTTIQINTPSGSTAVLFTSQCGGKVPPAIPDGTGNTIHQYWQRGQLLYIEISGWWNAPSFIRISDNGIEKECKLK